VSRFIGALQQLVANVRPYFVSGPVLGGLTESHAIALDVLATNLEVGLLMSQPLRCDASALPDLAECRGIRRYPSESEKSHRQRLSRWWQLHRSRGTHRGELENLQPYFGADRPLIRIVHQSGDGAIATWHTINASGTYERTNTEPSNWNYDGRAEAWSRFWLIIYIPSAWIVSVSYNGTGRYGTSQYAELLTQQARDASDLVKDWKAGHSRLAATIVCPVGYMNPTDMAINTPSGWTTMPNGNWGAPLTVNGHPTRPPWATWIYEDKV
jgi:hypothetical protein